MEGAEPPGEAMRRSLAAGRNLNSAGSGWSASGREFLIRRLPGMGLGGSLLPVAEPEPWQNLQRLRAAEGWIELGLLAEAQAELTELGPEWRISREGLEVQWMLFAQGRHWDAAFAVAQQTVELHPDVESGWVHRAYSARRRPGGGVPAARELLLPAVARFPRSPIIAFNLACYAAQSGEPDQAWTWLNAAADASSWAEIRKMALQDADLEPLWPRLRSAAAAGD